MHTVTMIGASWCNPCKTMRPIAEELSAQHNATFEYIDVESGDPRTANITSVPNLRLVNANGYAHEHTGAADRPFLEWLFSMVFEQ